MNCYCYETESEFVFCVENVETAYEENVQHAWFKKAGDRFLKTYPIDIDDKELIKKNFPRLGESMLISDGRWEESLCTFAKKCKEHGIEWYIIGSISEAVIGVKINPHDMDIIVHVKDFFRVKEIFADFLVEPFIDNKGTWVVRYFGRLCLDGFMVDIAADEKMNEGNHKYDSVTWNGFDLKVENLQDRYAVELQRNRKDRIKAIEEYTRQTK